MTGQSTPSAGKVSFAELLELLRRERGWSKRELAERAQLSASYLSMLTSAAPMKPSEASVAALARALELDSVVTARMYWAAGFSPPLELTGKTVIKRDVGNEPYLAGSEQFLPRDELDEVLKAILGENPKRLLLLLGPGGIGKTTLAGKVWRETEQAFDQIIWRSLSNSPKVETLVNDLINSLAGPKKQRIQLGLTGSASLADGHEELAAAIDQLLLLLRLTRCLIILDNAETLLDPRSEEGAYRAEYAGYGDLFTRLIETPHQSVVIVTSRERPQGMTILEAKGYPVKSIVLQPLGDEASVQLLRQALGTATPDDLEQPDLKRLVRLYRGNPLMLKIVGSVIRESFRRDVAGFLTAKTRVVDDISVLLESQFSRLSAAEKSALYWLAIEGNPISYQDLMARVIGPLRRDLSPSLSSLGRRSLLDTASPQAGLLSLHPVIAEYVLDQFVHQIVDEIEKKDVNLLNAHALLNALESDETRQAQIRQLHKPICDELVERLGGRPAVRERFKTLINLLRDLPEQDRAHGYAPGNIINLILHGLEEDVDGLDFSGLAVWDIDLTRRTARNVNFRGATFKRLSLLLPNGRFHRLAVGPGWGKADCWIAVATTMGRILLWKRKRLSSPDELELEDTLNVGADYVRAVAFHPQHLLASCGDDNQVHLWSLRQSQQPVQSLGEHTYFVYDVAWSRLGDRLASASADGHVGLWSIDLDTLRADPKGQFYRLNDNAQALCVGFSAALETPWLACGDNQGMISLWTVDRFGSKPGVEIQTGAGEVRAVAFHPHKELLAGCTDQTALRVWRLDQGRSQPLTDEQGANGVGGSSVAFSPDGQWIASGNDDGSVTIWQISEADRLEPRQVLAHAHTEPVTSVVFPDETTLFTCSTDQTIKLWQRIGEEWTLSRVIRGHSREVKVVACHPRQPLLATGGDERVVSLWTNLAATPQRQPPLAGHSLRVRALAFHPTKDRLASAGDDKIIRIWDVEDPTRSHYLRSLKGHKDWIRCLAFSPDGKWLVSAGEDREIYVWDTALWRLAQTHPGYTGAVWSVAFSASGQLLASASDDLSVRLWTVSPSGIQPREDRGALAQYKERVRTLAFSPDGQWLATGSDNGKIKLWDSQNLEERPAVLELEEGVRSIAFSPDSQCLAYGTLGGEVGNWDINNQRQVTRREKHEGCVWSVTFSADGQYIVSGGEDGDIYLWDPGSDQVTRRRSPLPYEGMDITAVTGLSPIQEDILVELGAFED